MRDHQVWAYRAGRVIHISRDVCVLRGDEEGPGVRVSRDLADWLRGCTSFRTLEGHARAGCRYPEDRAALVDAFRRRAEELVRAGICLTAESLRHRLAAEEAIEGPALNIAAVPSAGRPESARRVLQGLAVAAQRSGRVTQVVVADDSRNEAGESSYAMMVRQAVAQTGMEVLHVGPSRKKLWCAELARRAGVDPALVELALSDPMKTGFTCGANRNWVLLLTAGQAVWSLDDDMLISARCLGETDGAVRLGGGIGLFSNRFFVSEAEVLNLPEWENWDVWREQERWLGRRPVLLPGEELKPEGADAALVAKLTGCAVRVVAVFHGVAGRPLVQNPYAWLSLDGDSVDRMTKAGSWESLADDPWLGWAAAGPTLTSRTHFTGCSVAMDNSRLFPPFMPALHAEDAVQAVVLGVMAPAYAGLHLPAALLHLPPSISNRKGLDEVHHHYLSEAFILTRRWVEMADLSEGWLAHDPATRLAALGRTLEEVAGWPVESFAASCQEWAAEHRARMMQRMEVALDRLGTRQPQLRQRVDKLLKRQEELIREPLAWIPEELLRTFGPEMAWKRYQELIGGYGKIMQIWPALWEAGRLWREEAGMVAPGFPDDDMPDL